MDEQVFRTPFDGANRLPFQSADEVLRNTIPKLRLSNDDARDASAGHRALQPAADIFDLR